MMKNGMMIYNVSLAKLTYWLLTVKKRMPSYVRQPRILNWYLLFANMTY